MSNAGPGCTAAEVAKDKYRVLPVNKEVALIGILFDFYRLIEKHGMECELTAESMDGRFEGEEWVPHKPREPKKVTGIMIPKLDRMALQGCGAYKEQAIPLEQAAILVRQGGPGPRGIGGWPQYLCRAPQLSSEEGGCD